MTMLEHTLRCFSAPTWRPQYALIWVLLWVLASSHMSSAVSSANASKENRRKQMLSDMQRSPSDPSKAFFLGKFYQYEYDCRALVLSDESLISRLRSIGDEFEMKMLCNDRIIELYGRSRELSHTAGTVTFDYLGMLNDYGILLASAGRVSEARDVYSEAAALSPYHVSVLANWASLESGMGNHTAGDNLYDRAVKASSPAPAALLHNYGIYKFRQKDHDRAEELWREAFEQDGSMYLSLVNLATLTCNRGDREASQVYFQRAIDIAYTTGGRADSGSSSSSSSSSEDAAWSIVLQKITALVPVINLSEEQLLADRNRFTQELEWLLLNSPQNIQVNPVEAIGCSAIGYYLIYHGYEDFYARQLQAKLYSKMFGRILNYTSPHLAESSGTHPMPVAHGGEVDPEYVAYPVRAAGSATLTSEAKTKPDSRVHVGFMSAFFYHHSVGLLMRGVIKHLNRSLFKVHVITLNQVNEGNRDYLTREIEELSNGDSDSTMVHHLTGEVWQLQKSVADLRLDVLVFGEIGMDPITYFLSFAQLARRSAVFWGHAVTSGVTGMTAFAPHAKQDDGNGGAAARDREAEGQGRHTEADGGNWGGPDYYISSVLFEGELPQTHPKHPHRAYADAGADVQLAQLEYSERLLLFDSMTTYFEHPAAPLSAAEVRAIVAGRLREEVQEELLAQSGLTEAYIDVETIERMLQDKLDASPSHRLLRDDELKAPEGAHRETPRDTGMAHDAGHILSRLPSKLSYLLYLDPSLRATLPPSSDAFHLYGIPQTLYKLHPDMDYLIYSVLRSDRNGYIAFPKGNEKVWSETVIARLRRSMARFLCEESDGQHIRSEGIDSDAAKECMTSQRISELIESLLGRVIFVRSMSEREFLTFCAVSDVVLDPFPVGGGRSSFEIFSVGTPIVMLRSRTSILQLTLAMYRTMNSSDFFSGDCCVAYTADEYVHMATAVARNSSYASELRAQIRMLGQALLYADQRVISEWERALQFIHAAPRPVPNPTLVQNVDLDTLADERVCEREAHCVEKDTDGAPSILDTGSSDPPSASIRDRHSPWRREELHRLAVTHPRPPILLRDVAVVRCDIGAAHTRGNENAGACVAFPRKYMSSAEYSRDRSDRSAANVYSNEVGMDEERHSEEIAFNQTFTHFTGNQPDKRKEVQVIVRKGEDWRESCAALAAASDAFDLSVDKLNVLFMCAVTGRGIARSAAASPLHVFDLSLEIDGELWTNQVSIHKGDDLGQVLSHMQDDFSRTHSIADPLTGRPVPKYLSAETLRDVATSIEAAFLPVSEMGADEAIDFRQSFARAFLQHIQKKGRDSDFIDSYREYNSISRPVRSLEGFDILEPSCVESTDRYDFISDRDRLDGIDGHLDPESCPELAVPVAPTDKALQPTPEANLLFSKNAEAVEFEIFLGMTTCKRLPHFLRTARSLVHAAGNGLGLSNGLISKVVVVDDASSAEDRAAMQREFPAFTFIFKEVMFEECAQPGASAATCGRLKGHASSMNVLVQEFLQFRSSVLRRHREGVLESNPASQKSVYFLYLEDDWEVLRPPVLHRGLAGALDLLGDSLVRAADGPASPTASRDADSSSRRPFIEIVLAAAAALRFPDGKSVQQILFNEQSRRACATGESEVHIKDNEKITNHEGVLCDLSVLGRGGWQRTSGVAMKAESGSVPLRIPYSLHEFGIVATKGAHGDRDHSFSMWPGMSLNPGLWDLAEIINRLQQCVPVFTSKLPSRHLEDDLSDTNHRIYESNTSDTRTSSLSGDCPHSDRTKRLRHIAIFNETDILFEQRFSALAMTAGIRVAYLPSLVFRHTGDVSAYQLSNTTRPWD